MELYFDVEIFGFKFNSENLDLLSKDFLNELAKLVLVLAYDLTFHFLVLRTDLVFSN
jgi:hypothetical protein